jgi:NADH:ubiquinone oxidoreductase subunit F (NADH-binding)
MGGMAIALELLPRLLAGIGEHEMTELDQHLDVHGAPPELRRVSPQRLIAEVEASGLRGHGGASFPVATKMRAVAARGRIPVVLVNGLEGEPASKKDRVLLRRAPHLVLDGAAVAARATGSDKVIIALASQAEESARSLARALAQRRAARLPGDPSYELVGVEQRYIAGQETALVDAVKRRPGQADVHAPATVRAGRQAPADARADVETLAHLALVARHGARWFRQLGMRVDPGSALVTVTGAVAAPGVYEVEHGMPLAELLELAAADAGVRAVLVGGYFGSWLSAAEASQARLDSESLRGYRASLGAGVIVVLGAGMCPVSETSRVTDFLASASAGQCGPCVNGLDAIAFAVHQLASGTATRVAPHDLERWLREVPGRGACQHPDGAIRFLDSALRVFSEEFATTRAAARALTAAGLRSSRSHASPGGALVRSHRHPSV